MITIDDVAARAKVSRMTVSRVINNNGYVKEDTRDRINAVIKELNYRPNMIAKSLVTGRSRIIAYVMVNISDPFHNLVSMGLETVSFERGYTTMVCDTHFKSRETDYINMFKDRCIDGAVFHHLAITQEQVDELESAGVKCVLLDNEMDIPGVCNVKTDNYYGGYIAAEYLISKGHERIGCVHGVLSRPNTDNIAYEDTFQYDIWNKRTSGFLDALKNNRKNTQYLYQGNGLSDHASVCSKKIVKDILNSTSRPTALYCENDVMAISLINEFQEHEIKIPSDIAIIGHDGLDICRMIHPYITTIAQPRYKMGSISASILIDQIEGKKSENVILKPELIVGETS